MNSNSALIVPAQPSATNSAADLAFREAPKPLLDIFNVWFWVWLLLILLVIATVAFFLWRRWRKKASEVPATPPIPPQVRARRLLDEALALLSEPKLFTIRVSDALRQYLEARFEFHAPERTTEEFLYELQNTRLLNTDQKERLSEFLSACDLVKFAKYEPTEVELRNLHGSALRLVNETEPPTIAAEIGSTIASNQPQSTQP